MVRQAPAPDLVNWPISRGGAKKPLTQQQGLDAAADGAAAALKAGKKAAKPARSFAKQVFDNAFGPQIVGNVCGSANVAATAVRKTAGVAAQAAKLVGDFTGLSKRAAKIGTVIREGLDGAAEAAAIVGAKIKKTTTKAGKNFDKFFADIGSKVGKVGTEFAADAASFASKTGSKLSAAAGSARTAIANSKLGKLATKFGNTKVGSALGSVASGLGNAAKTAATGAARLGKQIANSKPVRAVTNFLHPRGTVMTLVTML